MNGINNHRGGGRGGGDNNMNLMQQNSISELMKQFEILKSKISKIVESKCKTVDYNSSLSGYVRFTGSKDTIVENVCNTLSYLNMIFGKMVEEE